MINTTDTTTITSEANRMSRDTAIAIVGVAGVFPAADDLETFWHNIAAKRCAIAPVPSRRWGVPTEQIQAAEICADRIRSLKAGLIEAVPFEPELFDLPRDLKTALDPLHRLVLTAGRTACENCHTQLSNLNDHYKMGVRVEFLSSMVADALVH
mgnify:CR=1 FL=1